MWHTRECFEWILKIPKVSLRILHSLSANYVKDVSQLKTCRAPIVLHTRDFSISPRMQNALKFAPLTTQVLLALMHLTSPQYLQLLLKRVHHGCCKVSRVVAVHMVEKITQRYAGYVRKTIRIASENTRKWIPPSLSFYSWLKTDIASDLKYR